MSPLLISLGWILLGLVALVAGGELLVRGASLLAGLLRISPLVIGLTVVAFGTSAPELAVSVQAAWQGQGELAIGNVVGSNIANVLLILGISALIVPLVVSSQLIRFDVPLMVVVSAVFLGLAYDGRIGRLDGGLLFTGIVVYTVWVVRQSRRENAIVMQEFAESMPEVAEERGSRSSLGRILWQLGLIVVGLILLVAGANRLVLGATTIARLWHVSELVIGLTIVAVGTSLPEIAASIIAGLRGQRDIAVGNVVGSNLFNLLSVVGLASLVTPGGIAVPPTAIAVDIPIMLAVAVSCLPVFFTGHRIDRWEGGLFLFYYAAYLTFVVALATQAAWIDRFTGSMFFFVLPLTVVTLLVGVARAWRSSNQRVDTE